MSVVPNLLLELLELEGARHVGPVLAPFGRNAAAIGLAHDIGVCLGAIYLRGVLQCDGLGWQAHAAIAWARRRLRNLHILGAMNQIILARPTKAQTIFFLFTQAKKPSAPTVFFCP